LIHATTTPGAFRHEALFYDGDAEFVSGTSGFIKDGLDNDDHVLVVVGARKIDLLRDALGPDAAEVQFADMAAVGGNPGRIISAWADFVGSRPAGRALRGIGEPIDAQRSPEEVIECERHEALLNLAFADARDFWLLCPYDTASLDAGVIETAGHTHPLLAQGDHRWESRGYGGLDLARSPFDAPLPPPPPHAESRVFGAESLGELRRFVGGRARAAGLDLSRADDLVLAASEVAANSVRHGGGSGMLSFWRDPGAVVCQVQDAGPNVPPLAGRQRPDAERVSGRGLWMANHLCDLVQIRSLPPGTIVRLHTKLSPS
jgi:anti-sigma regulatory factor (Ser/Thr protein kinase)